jgi:anti-anti-sigma factor
MRHNPCVDRDELFIDLALKAGLLSAAQVEECRKQSQVDGRTSAAPSIEEVVGAKALLTPEQMRLLHIAIQYEELKQEDEALAAYLVRKGFLTEDKVSGFLAAQEVPYREGQPIPRLEDMLIRKGHLTAQQMDNILRSWERGATGSRMAAAPPPKSAGLPSDPPPRNVSPQKLKLLEQGLRQETLKVPFRKSRIDSDLYAAVLQLSGSLDGHTSYKFDQYLNAITEAGFSHLVLDCGRLEYLSSAGIGILAATIKRCREGRGDMVLCSVEDKMRRVMQIIGLLSLVKTYENEKTAVASFRGGTK